MTTAQFLHAPPERVRDETTLRERLAVALHLEAAGPNSWRVCDSRVEIGHGRFLAFVERKHDVFEVMQLADDFVWAEFPTMEAALTHVVVSNAVVSDQRAAGELAWLV